MLAKMVLLQNVDLHSGCTPGHKHLASRCRYGDTEAVEDFLAIGKDVNMVDDQLRTALHYAVAYAQMEAFEALLQGGADLERADVKANTPLHYAAGYGR